jgi:hypothetical protein
VEVSIINSPLVGTVVAIGKSLSGGALPINTTKKRTGSKDVCTGTSSVSRIKGCALVTEDVEGDGGNVAEGLKIVTVLVSSDGSNKYMKTYDNHFRDCLVGNILSSLTASHNNFANSLDEGVVVPPMVRWYVNERLDYLGSQT